MKLAKFADITDKDYAPAGGTPLLDAAFQFIELVRGKAKPTQVQVGILCDESGSMRPNTEAVIASVNDFVGNLRKVATVDDKVAGKGFLVVATDGEENSSRTHTYEDVSGLVADAERDGWVIVFLGANLDAWAEGAKLGLSGTAGGQMVNYTSSPVGTRNAIANVAASTVDYLEDSVKYRTAAAASALRTVSEDGTVSTDAPTGPAFTASPPRRERPTGPGRRATKKG